MRHYIAFLRKDKDSDYGVEFPDLPGCVTAGSTLEEARIRAAEALGAHIRFLLREGEEIPQPSTLDETMKKRTSKGAVPFLVAVDEPAGKAIRVNITIPERVLREIDEYAERNGMSRSAFVTKAAQEKIAKTREMKR